jgi:hypothetical protein
MKTCKECDRLRGELGKSEAELRLSQERESRISQNSIEIAEKLTERAEQAERERDRARQQYEQALELMRLAVPVDTLNEVKADRDSWRSRWLSMVLYLQDRFDIRNKIINQLSKEELARRDELDRALKKMELLEILED